MDVNLIYHIFHVSCFKKKSRCDNSSINRSVKKCFVLNCLQYLASRKYSITELLEELIMKYLSDELYERKRIHAEETAEHSK